VQCILNCSDLLHLVLIKLHGSTLKKWLVIPLEWNEARWIICTVRWLFWSYSNLAVLHFRMGTYTLSPLKFDMLTSVSGLLFSQSWLYGYPLMVPFQYKSNRNFNVLALRALSSFSSYLLYIWLKKTIYNIMLCPCNYNNNNKTLVVIRCKNKKNQ